MIVFNRTGGRLFIWLALITLLTVQGVARADGDENPIKRMFIFGDD